MVYILSSENTVCNKCPFDTNFQSDKHSGVHLIRIKKSSN